MQFVPTGLPVSSELPRPWLTSGVAVDINVEGAVVVSLCGAACHRSLRVLAGSLWCHGTPWSLHLRLCPNASQGDCGWVHSTPWGLHCRWNVALIGGLPRTGSAFPTREDLPLARSQTARHAASLCERKRLSVGTKPPQPAELCPWALRCRFSELPRSLVPAFSVTPPSPAARSPQAPGHQQPRAWAFWWLDGHRVRTWSSQSHVPL